MIPLLVTLGGLTVIVICLLVLKKTGGALFMRRLREAVAKDKKRFGSDDKVG